MTIAQARGLREQGAVRPAGLLPQARWMFNRLFEILRWFVGLVALVFGFAYPSIGRAGGDLPLSLWENFTANGPSWFVFALGAMAASAFLPTMVANGMTRRRFTVAAALALAAGALLLSVLVAAGFLYETAMYARYGWQHTLNGDHLFAATSQVHLVVAEYAVRYVLYGLTGLLAGYGFYRTGGWWGTLLLLVTVVPPLAIGQALLAYRPGAAVLDWSNLFTATPLGIGLTLVFEVLLLVVARALIATVPIRAKVG